MAALIRCAYIIVLVIIKLLYCTRAGAKGSRQTVPVLHESNHFMYSYLYLHNHQSTPYALFSYGINCI